MKISKEVLSYLKGEKFRTTLSVNIEKKRHPVISRESAITKMIKNRSVIHIGCSDHISVINEKIKDNIWLHKLIDDNSKKCAGIDIDRESIDYLKNELGYKNVHYGNVLTDDFPVITEGRWDYVVFGEIIEHLDDPVIFLNTFKRRFGSFIGNFIITVPNIYNKRQYMNMKNYREIINSDHRFWFTPYTIAKILVSAGYDPEKISYTNLEKLTSSELIMRKVRQITGLKVKYPFYYFNTIIVSGKIN